MSSLGNFVISEVPV
uniref:Uncharacterized protein n=1 Tax=Arundo donax TaxID=35708 RepID=A0A0A9BP85_ARUDO